MKPRSIPACLAAPGTSMAAVFRIACVLIAFGIAAGAGAAPGSPALGPGTHALDLVHDGLRRQYLVHVPRGHDSSRPAPVVLVFHGGGGDARFMADDRRYGWIPKAEREGFVAVFPNGFSRLPGGKLATWNAGDCCAGARDRNIDDVGFVRALLERLKRQVAVDDRRLFATGMSNGGMMAYRLACEMADVFLAVTSVAGTEAARTCTPARPISVQHIHARDDTHVLFDGGAGPDAFRDPSKVTDFTSVPETVSRWTGRNRCEGPARRQEMPGAYCEVHERCAGGVEVRLCVTDSGGHGWPGGGQARPRKAPPSKALSATDEAWAFFASRPTRQP